MIRLKVLVILFLLASSHLCIAGVVSTDSVYGSDSLTFDSDQNLYFLDLNLTQGQSINYVTSEFGVGGVYEGFRYATELEVVTLINNFGFLPGALEDAEVDGIAGTSLAALVDMLGVTDQQVLLGGEVRASNGITADLTAGTRETVRIFDVLIPFGSKSEDYVVATQQGFTGEMENAVYGSFIVSNAQPVPAPASMVFLTGLVLVLVRRLQ